MDVIGAKPGLVEPLLLVTNQHSQSQMIIVTLNRNVKYVGGQYGLKDEIKVKTLRGALGQPFTTLEKLRRDSIISLYKYATQWEDLDEVAYQRGQHQGNVIAPDCPDLVWCMCHVLHCVHSTIIFV